jgi:hypothetical protein
LRALGRHGFTLAVEEARFPEAAGLIYKAARFITID